MFGLARDFIQQDGITMLLGKPEGLAERELNMVQARMLMNTGIPHHLRLLLREIDLKVTLEYAVSRRKMLGTLLKSEKLGMMEFFGLLLQIAAGMEEGRLYMLRAEQYALHEDYIFIEGPLSSGKVFLTYIPLQCTEPALRPGEALKSLIIVFMAAIHELSGDGMQRLLQYCGEEDFSPLGLKELLAELLTGGDGHGRHTHIAEPPVMNTLQTGAAAPAPPGDREAQQKHTLRNAEESRTVLPARVNFAWNSGAASGESSGQTTGQAPWMNSAPRLKVREELPETDMPDRADRAADGSSAYKTYILLGGVLGDALLWKFLYLNHPGTPGLAICAAATLGLAVLGWLVWTGRIAWGSAEDEDAGGLPEDGAGVKNGTAWPLRELEWDYGRTPAVSPGSPASTSPRPEPYAAAATPALKPADRQETLWGTAAKPLQVKEPAASAATILLSREQHPDKGPEFRKSGRTAPYLERSDSGEGGAPETIELNRPSFIIGRSSEVAQYVEKSEGTSRVHAEISRSSGGYILKDLDSRNGTLLAGEAMIPYKEYPLTEGAVFTIVKGCYTFHTA